jgi:serine/threonine protein kinase
MGLTELTGEVLDEKYRIEKELGKGGMGAVYLATHLGTDRPVAVKVITPQFMMNDEFVERFRREAKAAGRLTHPNVVNVTDFGFARVDGQRIAYLVMEYLDGCTLADVLAEESQLPIDWVLDIIDQTCSAVDEAHHQGIIHRDLKPDNIWLEPNRRGGYTVKVLDFGLAKLGEIPVNEPSGSPKSASSNSMKLRRASTTVATDQRNTQVSEAKTHAAASDMSETATRLQPAPMSPAQNSPAPNSEDATQILVEPTERNAPEPNEAATQILPSEASLSSEAATRVQPAPVSDEAQTRVLEHTTAENLPRQTVPADGLTRVGSILGTPLYMSPEQCRSDQLDWRTDIYSIGVIAYQMLAGAPPFTGAAPEVMRLHIEAPPPELREKRRKIKKRMAAMVMSALAKNPAERPATAAGFASALRANAEGAGALLRRAFSLYAEHFPKFFGATFLMYLPLIALHVALLISGIMNSGGPGTQMPDSGVAITTTPSSTGGRVKLTSTPGSAIEIVLSILTFLLNVFINAVIAGVTIRLVTQLFLAPLRPLELRTAYASVRKRLKSLLFTIAIASIRSFLGMLLLIPGIIMFINYSLASPVVMMEGLKGRAALKRSKALVKRSRLTVIMILLFQFAIPAFISAIVAGGLGAGLKLAKVGNAPMLAGRITSIIAATLNAVILPLIATMTALLYLKTRQIGGETLKEVLSQFEEEDVPRTKWQMRMRERLHTTASKSSSSESSASSLK